MTRPKKPAPKKQATRKQRAAKAVPAPRKRAPRKRIAVPPPAPPATPGELALAQLRAVEPRHATFVERLMVHNIASQAYTEAGYTSSVGAAKTNGARLRAHPDVVAVLALLRAEQGARTLITAEAVLQRQWAIATADANDLVEYRRTCCRYCYGEGHRYQRTPAERERAVATWQLLTKGTKARAAEPFDEMGGMGYDPRMEPHPECPECHGEGEGSVMVKDTRLLTPEARALYAGVRITEKGLEVKMHDQQGALQEVAKLIGAYKAPEGGAAGALAGVQINVNGGPTGLEVTVQAVAATKGGG